MPRRMPTILPVAIPLDAPYRRLQTASLRLRRHTSSNLVRTFYIGGEVRLGDEPGRVEHPVARLDPHDPLADDRLGDPMRPFAEDGELHQVIVDRERYVLPDQRGVLRPCAITRKDAPSYVISQHAGLPPEVVHLIARQHD